MLFHINLLVFSSISNVSTYFHIETPGLICKVVTPEFDTCLNPLSQGRREGDGQHTVYCRAINDCGSLSNELRRPTPKLVFKQNLKTKNPH